MASKPITVTVVDDFEIVVHGVAAMLAPFEDRVRVVELALEEPITKDVDVVLFDTFGQGEVHVDDIEPLLQNPHAGHVAVFTFNFANELIATARSRGVHGYLSKALDAASLVDAIERIHAGEIVVAGPTSGRRSHTTTPRGWPGKDRGLTEREAEVLTLATQGLTNAEIAERLFISINSVKTHVRHLYRKIGAHNRAQAVAWGIDNGFRPAHSALDRWITQQ